MALTLLRHTPPHIAAGLCYGATDVGVDSGEVAALAAHLAQNHAAPAHIWSSPLARCALLAAALQSRWPGAALTRDAALAEMSFGAWEGQTWDAIGKRAMDEWLADFANHAPGGGERTADFLLRVRSALLRAADGVATGCAVWWVTHAGVMRAVAWWLAGSAAPERAAQVRSEDWPRFALDFGATQVHLASALAQWRTGSIP
jgi:alpha-ribazole phosphatase